MKIQKKCGNCEHLTNVPEESRAEDNVMGGCFVDGHIVTTDCIGCKHWKKYDNNRSRF